MTAKGAVLVAVVLVLTVATFPYSVPVVIVAAGVMWYRQRSRAVTRPTGGGAYDGPIAELERRLTDAIRETEARTHMKYSAWKLRQQQERQYFLDHGVTMPETDTRSREDAMFRSLEWRMEEEKKRFHDEALRIEQEERLKLEDLRQREDAAVIAARQHELELARIQKERDAAEAIAKALQGDLA